MSTAVNLSAYPASETSDTPRSENASEGHSGEPRIDAVPASSLELLYGRDAAQRERFAIRVRDLTERCRAWHASGSVHLFSSPGRIEFCGNHTDHNGGVVLSAAVTLDMLAAVCTTGDLTITLDSGGTHSDRPREVTAVPADRLVSSDELGTATHTASLVHGVVAGFLARGLNLRGVFVALASDVPQGSGLSSSASLAMLLVTVFDELFNDGRMLVTERAFIAQEAEQRYWHKPVGLLDQLACGSGGLVLLDFRGPLVPGVTPLDLEIPASELALLTVDPGGDHSALGEYYARIAYDMRAVARELGGERLIDADEHIFLREIHDLRRKVGDRAVLRALHFYGENRRVFRLADAVAASNYHDVLDILRESGRSSWEFLQNVTLPDDNDHQPLAIALALVEHVSRELGVRFGYRVHGGGFAGRILVVSPRYVAPTVREKLNAYFNREVVQEVFIRKLGTSRVSG